MALTLEEFAPGHMDQVRAFNAKLAQTKTPYRLSESPVDGWLPKEEGRQHYVEQWLMLDNGVLRGGFKLRHQPSVIRGQEFPLAHLQGPVSEALLDPAKFASGAQLLLAALRKQPLLYGYGMGGLNPPFPRLLASAGWSLAFIPFLFRIVHPRSFLREIAFLRTTRKRRLALDFLNGTGLGPAGLSLLFARFSPSWLKDYSCEEVDAFGPWADPIWQALSENFTCSAIRSTAALREVYGTEPSANRKLRIRRDGADVGWAVVRSTPMQGHKQFGNMVVASIIDNLAMPGEERAVCRVATRFLLATKPDLLVTNQSHSAWVRGFRHAGYFQGPSNFAIGCSPPLMKQIGEPLAEALPGMHFTRSDGDGPIHL